MVRGIMGSVERLGKPLGELQGCPHSLLWERGDQQLIWLIIWDTQNCYVCSFVGDHDGKPSQN